MKVVSLGEIMLRLKTPEFQRFTQASSFEASYGGGEANVAVSIAGLGEQAVFVSKLPKNPLGDAALNQLRALGVDTSHISRGGKRLGVYFLEAGSSVRPSDVIYDRADSSISQAKKEDFDLEKIFKDATWFHVSGISPALSPDSKELTKVFLKYAKEKSITTSVDLNYRKKLWSLDDARKTMTELMQYTDICIGNEEDAQNSLGFSMDDNKVESGKLKEDSYKDLLMRMQEKFKFKNVAITLRESISASDNNWSALLYDGKDLYRSKKYSLRITDRVGSGDSFASGLIYGLSKYSSDKQKALEFAVANSALKHTIHGDFNLVSKEEVIKLMEGDGSGRIQR